MAPGPKPLYSALTIAGSDSGGGAGIQADLKTFAALGCYGTSAITALTAQNTIGVRGVHPTPPSFIEEQIHVILEDTEISAIKTGMLCNVENTQAVVRALKAYYKDTTLPPLVCDPVCVSTSGHTLLDPRAIQVMIDELFPLASLITPNKAEAELLLSHRNVSIQISNVEDMLSAAQQLLLFGSQAVLLKGGHVLTTMDDVEQIIHRHPEIVVVRYGFFDENMEILQIGGKEPTNDLVVDLLYQPGGSARLFIRPRIASTSTHGTGCTLSAALASELAHGTSLTDAIRSATAYTHIGIETSQPIGKGNGPLNHFHSVTRLSVPQPTPSNPYPFTRFLIQGTAKAWKEYVEHDFVKLLGMGTLPERSFTHFIKQDYQYLRYYARAYGLLVAKSTSYTAMHTATQTILNIISETATQKALCASFGVSEEELENAPQSTATTAYGAYILDVGLQGDSTLLLIALLACLLGYGEVGLWLKQEAKKPNTWVMLNDNPYQVWIDDYSGERYQNAVQMGLEVIEARAVNDPPSPARLETWLAVWEKCTKLEKGFWDMGLAG